MSEEYFKIKIEQDVLNNMVDSGKITLDENYYHKRSIRLMKEAQEFGIQVGKQQTLKDELEFLKGRTSPIMLWEIRERIKQIEKELGEKK